jgi:hypothetical protein
MKFYSFYSGILKNTFDRKLIRVSFIYIEYINCPVIVLLMIQLDMLISLKRLSSISDV